ncbi:XRE family transcriptional regulator [Gemmobacter lanyuensis]|uniref:XRE family transcriptional regulator n=1 Tax=Gemmobacter lanyuensis TaxID=1054497 RepID=A0A918MGS0_9RHOB|nr:helix-turn-helix transcriptional regulator [Gemmobacter lanyuensis]GGW21198.1 XRE family transcriptional regulator [Gemmobacter lanyuensis]
MALNELTGTRVRERRLALGLRQADVARAAGISASYLNLIEHNRRRITGEALDRLAQALGVETGALEAGAAGVLAGALREAAREPGGEGAELDRLEEFIGRYPGWAGLTAGLQQRVGQLERAVAALNDRIAHDPHLGAALHEVLSAVSSVRSTAGILAETEDIEPEWRARFHANLYQDSERLARGAEALVAYLEGAEQDTTIRTGTPEEEVDLWMAARGWDLQGLGGEALAELGSEAARELAQDQIRLAEADARALPEGPFRSALADLQGDPVQVAARFGAGVVAVMRRMATLPEAPEGVVVCDGAGALTFRKPAAGFRPPRFGAACALWPLFTALARPFQPIEAVVELAERTGEWFRVRAFCETGHPGGFSGVEVRQAAMILTPLQAGRGPGAAGPVLRIGPTCRICPEATCPARRERSILGGT